ncbi:MAG: glycosyltransferase, partial [Acidiferrobacterales bacterium]|nr:glycosyltransferase [Acidiferrobacterales bacterium]
MSSTVPVSEDSNEPRFVVDLCNLLSTQFELKLLTQNRPGSVLFERRENIDIERYRYAPLFLEKLSENGGINNTLKQNPWYLFVVPFLLVSQVIAIIKQLKNWQPDAIHAHWIIPQGICAIVAKILSKSNVPIVITSHGSDVYGLKGKLLLKVKRWVIQRCTSYCVVSESMKRKVISDLNIDRELINVLPMGADLSSVFSLDFKIQRKPGQVVFAGRLINIKGVPILIEAFTEILKRFPWAELIIAGEGPERPKLEQLIAKNNLESKVKLVGSVSHHRLAH